ncbi:MAG: HEPN domain-containing protein [Proteobacteria bacterium]|nr:HEPN domain-containing protein [Pseudomonadota bacterium]
MNKSDLETLVDIRVKEAKLLLDNNCYEGAYYLLGYALECAIKACIAKQVREHDFPDKQLANAAYTHRLGDLLGVAGLKQKLQEKEKTDEEFKLNWAVTKDWSEDARYEHTIEETTAKDFFRAITNKKTGILVWIKSWW